MSKSCLKHKVTCPHCKRRLATYTTGDNPIRRVVAHDDKQGVACKGSGRWAVFCMR